MRERGGGREGAGKPGGLMVTVGAASAGEEG